MEKKSQLGSGLPNASLRLAHLLLARQSECAGSEASVNNTIQLELNDFCLLVFVFVVAIYIWPSIQHFHLW